MQPFVSPSSLRPVFHVWVLMAALLGFCGSTWAQHSAARVMVVSGSAQAIDLQGRERPLEKGAELFSGDKVVTANGALVQMRLNDGGYISVRPNTEMVIDRFVHDEKDASNSNFLVSLLRGGFRSITGLIGRTNPNAYQIRSATATIGIRGTDHEPMVVLDTPDTPGQAEPGLYDKVNEGETFIRNSNGILSLKRGDVGFASFATDSPPQILLKIPDFYKAEVKASLRERKDGVENKSDGKADGDKRARAAAAQLQPSVAERRDAIRPPDGSATPTGQTPMDRSPMATPAYTPLTAPTQDGTPPLLTPEQKKAIVLQANTLLSAPKAGTNTGNLAPANTLTAPAVPAPTPPPIMIAPLPK